MVLASVVQFNVARQCYLTIDSFHVRVHAVNVGMVALVAVNHSV